MILQTHSLVTNNEDLLAPMVRLTLGYSRLRYDSASHSQKPLRHDLHRLLQRH